MIAYAISAFLLSCSGLMLATSKLAAEFFSIALFATGTCVVMAIMLTSTA